MKTITTRDELQDAIEDAPMYVRWSNGPEADAANGWISRNWAQQYTYNDEGEIDGVVDGYDEAGLSVVPVADVRDVWAMASEVNGQVCYILTGDEVGECADGFPLLVNVIPIAFVAESAM